MKTYIIAADRIIDGQGSHKETEHILKKATKTNLNVRTLTVVNLARRWEDKLSSDEFKSGASAMAAIEKARKILKAKKADLVVIKGEDLLKTGYQKEDREKFMKLYQNKYTPLDGYDRLVPLFLKQNRLTEKEYFQIRDQLFENYLRTWKSINRENKLPDERWYQPLTKYFRGIDCANPNVDYSGQIILCSEKIADKSIA